MSSLWRKIRHGERDATLPIESADRFGCEIRGLIAIEFNLRSSSGCGMAFASPVMADAVPSMGAHRAEMERPIGRQRAARRTGKRDGTKESNMVGTSSTTRMSHADHSEGMLARAIEDQTAKLPSDAFLWAATASIVGSLILQSMGDRHRSLFIGQWAPTLLILGLYNKLVKVSGHDYRS
jgi:hypothetical protein